MTGFAGRKPLLRQLFRYGVAGILTNLFGYLVYLLITFLGVDPKVVVSVIYPLSAVTGFFAHFRYSFSYRKGYAGAAVRYSIAHCIGFGVNLAMLYVLSDKLKFPHQAVQAAAIFVVAGILFLIFRYFVFPSSGFGNPEGMFAHRDVQGERARWNEPEPRMPIQPREPIEAGPLGIEVMLEELHAIVEKRASHLLPLFETFAQEARFARGWLGPGLANVPGSGPILEVGAGLMLLSCQLVREGYAVTALEPIGHGYSHFTELQAIVLRYAAEHGVAPVIVRIPVEELTADGEFPLVFSVNVMEHVENVPMAIRTIGKALMRGGEYRFICPNYTFPYEPHFDTLTLFSKKLTEYFLGSRILRSDKVVDPQGVWRSLNWITVSLVKREVRRAPGIEVRFGRRMFGIALLRAINDKEFASRRAGWVRMLARGIVWLRLHELTEYLPPQLHPIIDCTMTRSLDSRPGPGLNSSTPNAPRT